MPETNWRELEAVATRVGTQVRRGLALADLGTLRLGGPCACLLDCPGAEAASLLRAHLRAAEIPHVVLGLGSNILFSDQGYAGAVLRIASPSAAPELLPGPRLRVSAGLALQALVDAAAEAGWAGLAFLNGIPGTVGGAVAGNAGAWGEQIGDRVLSVELLDPEGQRVTLAAGDCGFAYRDSRLKHDGSVILSVDLAVTPGDPQSLRQERGRILALRRERHPPVDLLPSIGSFFRNLAPSSAAERRQAAGYFLEQAGAKQLRVGGAAVFPGHANIIIKAAPDCTAQDVLDLSHKMRDAVHAAFGLHLQREIRLLGPFAGEPGPHPGFH